MFRAAIASLFVLTTLGGCAGHPATAPVGVIEPAAEEPAWMGIATPADQLRIAQLHARFVAAHAAVPRSRSKMLAAEAALVDPTAAQVLPQLPPGPYYCRLIRFGGSARLASFKPDFCYVNVEEKGLSFTKQTGTNLPEGWILPDGDTRQIFLGTFRREGEPGGKRYGDDPASDIAGIVERVSPFRWRLILTRAGGGATLDLYELVPVPPQVPGATPAAPSG